MIDLKIQEIFDYFYGDEISWRDTTIKGVHYYYAENGLYIFRIPYGYHYAYISISDARSVHQATQVLAESAIGKL